MKRALKYWNLQFMLKLTTNSVFEICIVTRKSFADVGFVSFCFDVDALVMLLETASLIKNISLPLIRSPNRWDEMLNIHKYTSSCYPDAEFCHVFNTKPPPPLNPAQTKRSEGEPSVEKARFSSLVREERLLSTVVPVRTPMESRTLERNQDCSEVHTPNAGPAPDKKNENGSSR